MATRLTGYLATAFALVNLDKAAQHDLLNEIVRNVQAGKYKPVPEKWNEPSLYETLMGNGCFVARFSFDTRLVYKVTRIRSDGPLDADCGIKVIEIQ